MALVAAEVGQLRAERAAPRDAAAVVAGMAGVGGVGHRGDQFAHQRGVAAEAVAGGEQHVATEVFDLPVRPLDGDAEHAVVVIDMQGGRACTRHRGNAGGCSGAVQHGHQRRTGALGRRVHATRGVAGVEKAVEHVPLQTVALLQGIERGCDGLGVGAHEMRSRRAVCLAVGVGSERIDRVVDAGSPLR